MSGPVDAGGGAAPEPSPGGDWAAVAAPGTDPGRLAAVVGRAVADPRGTAASWRRARASGDDPAMALEAVVGSPPVPGLPSARDGGSPSEHVAAAWRRAGARVALAGDPGMPHRLVRHDVVPPWWVAVGPDPAPGPAVAIVGSRAASGYGTGLAAWLAESAADAGVHVVSGGAVGIDAAAHEASHDRPARTTVVLGCGHAVPYPRPHAGADGLFDRVRQAGGRLVSESLAGDPARPHRVRSRNRLIAALADAVVVVEGGARSGSLVTAGWAADLGLPVLAVPGDVRAAGSAAPHQLLREGAAVCTGPADLLGAVTSAVGPADAPGDPGLDAGGLPAWLADPLATAWPRPVPLAGLATASGRGAGAVLAAVTRGQVAGLLARDVEGVRLRRRPEAST